MLRCWLKINCQQTFGMGSPNWGGVGSSHLRVVFLCIEGHDPLETMYNRILFLVVETENIIEI